MKINRILLIVLTGSVLLGLAECAHQPKSGVPEVKSAAHPEAGLNPMDPAAGDFLTIDLDSIMKKADTAYREKKYEDCARFYLEYLKFDIQNSRAIYNLACCYALLGNESLASKYLERSFRSGFKDIQFIDNDKDFDSVRNHTIFKDTLAKLQKMAESEQLKSSETLILESKILVPCYIFLPPQFDSEKKYPLIIGLHGFGGNPTDFARLWDDFSQPEFIFVVIQAPYMVPDDHNPGYSWSCYNTPDEKIAADSVRLSQENISLAAVELSKKFHPSGIYLMGFSQGASLALLTGIRYSEQFAGAIAFGGWIDPEDVEQSALDRVKNLKIFIAHGKTDGVVEYQKGVDTREFFLKNGNPVTFVEFNGGHIVDKEAFLQVPAWLNN